MLGRGWPTLSSLQPVSARLSSPAILHEPSPHLQVALNCCIGAGLKPQLRLDLIDGKRHEDCRVLLLCYIPSSFSAAGVFGCTDSRLSWLLEDVRLQPGLVDALHGVHPHRRRDRRDPIPPVRQLLSLVERGHVVDHDERPEMQERGQFLQCVLPDPREELKRLGGRMPLYTMTGVNGSMSAPTNRSWALYACAYDAGSDDSPYGGTQVGIRTGAGAS
jgi:hypothetical protein